MESAAQSLPHSESTGLSFTMLELPGLWPHLPRPPQESLLRSWLGRLSLPREDLAVWTGLEQTNNDTLRRTKAMKAMDHES